MNKSDNICTLVQHLGYQQDKDYKSVRYIKYSHPKDKCSFFIPGDCKKYLRIGRTLDVSIAVPKMVDLEFAKLGQELSNGNV